MPGSDTTTLERKTKAPVPRDRFLSWWHGYDPPAGEKEPAGKRGGRAVEKPPEQVLDLTTRVNVVQAVWGEGHVSPGSAEFVIHLAKPLRLAKDLSAVDLGAGLGGCDRELAKEFGVWIDGLEADREFVNHGVVMAKKLGMEKKATLNPFDPEIIELPERKYDRVLSKELWSAVNDKSRLLKQVVKTLRAKGEVLLIDFTVGEKPGAQSRVDAALAADGRIREPWPANAYVEALKVNGLEVRIADDITDMYLEVIGSELLRLHAALRADPNFVPTEALTRELTIWLQRIDLMRDETLRLHRFHAIKANAPKPMSNW